MRSSFQKQASRFQHGQRRVLWRSMVLAVALAAGLSGGYWIAAQAQAIPSVAALKRYHIEKRLVSLDRIPKQLREAFIAAEDGDFWHEGALDYDAILRAAVFDLIHGRAAQGGSTITQQVARTLFLDNQKTLTRKVRGALLAYRLDEVWSKTRILDAYLNEVYLGRDTYGITAAARRYFGRRLRDLTLPQMALLAGLPANPVAFDPRRHPIRARARRNYVLQRMVASGFISRRTAQLANQESIRATLLPRPNLS